jgi:hypothetical protein
MLSLFAEIESVTGVVIQGGERAGSGTRGGVPRDRSPLASSWPKRGLLLVFVAEFSGVFEALAQICESHAALRVCLEPVGNGVQ